MKNRRLIAAISLILCFAFVVAGCSSSYLQGAKAEDSNTRNGSTADMAPQIGKAPIVTDGGEASAPDYSKGIVSDEKGIAPAPPASGGLYPENQKLIYQLTYSIETLEFDKSVTAISGLVKSLGGFTESTSVGGGPRLLEKTAAEDGISSDYKEPRYGNFTLRIPASKLSEFESKAGDLGNVTNSSKSSQDITLQYTDNEARLKSLKVQEERLLDMLKKSGNLADLIQVENALSNVRYQIESFTSMQRQYDSQVSYSFVTISLTEVIKYSEQVETPKTLWERISAEFKGSIKAIANTAENFVVWFLGNILFIILDIAILALLAFFGMKIYKKEKAKRETQIEKE